MNLSGPAGHLEHRLEQPDQARSITAILSHPHPQYGGNLNDAVLATAAAVLKAHQYSTLRFNFRGVGASAGSFDGSAEAQDLLAVTAAYADAYPEHNIWWIGYSFGAAMTLRALASRQPQRSLLIAPPNSAMQIPQLTFPPGTDVSAIAGERDSYVDAEGLAQGFDIKTRLIAGADHFFSGQHDELARVIEDWIVSAEAG
ncbi:MAG: hypothetical protein NXH95_12350 [Pseudomonadaceae bacterium]|nr:hypothetical protein [Pseudomonadaceae bacterium]